jgi:hypothetical protein
MPEEIEVPTEHLHEHMEHAAKHEGGNFNMGVALSSAILAVVAAIASLKAGHAANEAILLQAKSTNQWSYFQSKSIKETVLASKVDLIKALGKKADEKDTEKLAEYAKEKGEIQEEAKKLADESDHEMAVHVSLAKAVTFFQIAIALSAMAVLTKKRFLWYGGMGLGIVGAVLMFLGLSH